MKRIVLCCDGTWNSAEQKHWTNVLKLRNAVRVGSVEGVRQIVYYQEGVGTGSILERLPGLFGAGLGQNVQKAYRFLVESYDPGDELYLFGFSRGAYTARSTVGMVRKCGILRRDRLDLVESAYALHKNRGVSPNDSAGFRELNSVQANPSPGSADASNSDPFVPRVKFVGVWDTVGSLGIPLGIFSRMTQRRHAFHDVALSRIVENACHALAIDERRIDYRPTLWEQHPDAKDQRMEQRWFAGVHTDAGGGASDHRQADRALRWIMDKAAGCGLALEAREVGLLANDPVGPLHDSLVHIFRLRPLYRRPIGRGVPAEQATYLGGVSNETVDPAVIARNLRYPSYMPPNVVAYYREHPDELDRAKRSAL
jgi:uncharacterized protein (DUF2235 family)